MAVTKKKPGQTMKHNPPAKRKSAPRKASSTSSASVRSTSSRSPKRNSSPATATTKKHAVKHNPSYKRNGTVTNIALGALGGALVLVGADVVFARLPQFTAPVKMGITGVAAGLLYWFGRRIPVIGPYAPAVAGGLAMLTAYIGLSTYVVPWVLDLLGMGSTAMAPAAPAVTKEAAIQGDQGQLGMRLFTRDGSYLDVYTPQSEARANQLLAAVG